MHAPNESTRDTNGTNMLAGLPGWARAAFLLGVPSLIALGLTYYVTLGADAKLSHIDQTVTATELSAGEHDRRVTSSFGRLETRQDEMTRVLIALCVNAAKDETARNRCFGR